jgi:alkanesulfonate monooxygenase SsuD/methylene tetrahydromethanopterin reductase-like flavin-dependent oxidoreductase (luciferase family)
LSPSTAFPIASRSSVWFTASRQELPISLAALFPKMLEVCGEITQGVLVTRSTLDTGRRAARHIAIVAHRAGRRLEDIDIASLLPCSVAASRQEALDAMRPGVAFYDGFFPRYNCLIAKSGFSEATQAIRTVWKRGDREGTTRAVPDALIAAPGVVG